MISKTRLFWLVASICLLLSLSLPWCPPCGLLQFPRIYSTPEEDNPSYFNIVNNQHQIDDLTHFNNSLFKLASSLRPEDTRISLLTPLNSTLSLRLYDLAHRLRAYKTHFYLWQSLHLFSPSPGALTHRTNIHQLILSLPFPHHTLINLTQTYSTYQFFLSHFSFLLFPWTYPYHIPHSTLPLQIYHGGKGIVITSSDTYLPPLLTTIRTLRSHHNCTLPIEILYFGDSDLHPSSREQLELLPSVTTRDLSLLISNSEFPLLGWELKPFALLYSSFRQAILIDADVFFFRPPHLSYFNIRNMWEKECYFLKIGKLKKGGKEG